MSIILTWARESFIISYWWSYRVSERFSDTRFVSWKEISTTIVHLNAFCRIYTWTWNSLSLGNVKSCNFGWRNFSATGTFEFWPVLIACFIDGLDTVVLAWSWYFSLSCIRIFKTVIINIWNLQGFKVLDLMVYEGYYFYLNNLANGPPGLYCPGPGLLAPIIYCPVAFILYKLYY